MTTTLQPTAAEQALGMALPNRRMEEWRWTDLRQAITEPLSKTAPSPDIDTIHKILKTSPIASLKCRRIVFVNGKLDKSRSDLNEVAFEESAPNVLVKDPLIDLNQTLSTNGISLFFEDKLVDPIELVFVSSGQQAAFGNRVHYEVARGAQASVVETFLGEGDYLNSTVISTTVHDNARLDRVKLQLESAKSQHLTHSIYWLGENAKLNDFTLTSGARLTRENGDCMFLKQNADAKIAGAYLLNGKQHADTRLVMDHKVPHCTSREMFKCVMDDSARGIFQGKVIVRKHAQKTDGKQSSHALLLSEMAEFDAKPELEIFADDVVCGHGATAGDINRDHLFYLMSRGIPESEAKSLLIGAFVGEAFDSIVNDAMREAMVTFAQNWLTARKAK